MNEEHNTTDRNEILLIAMINEIIEVAGVSLLEDPDSLNWECGVWGHQCKFNYVTAHCSRNQLRKIRNKGSVYRMNLLQV